MKEYQSMTIKQQWIYNDLKWKYFWKIHGPKFASSVPFKLQDLKDASEQLLKLCSK